MPPQQGLTYVWRPIPTGRHAFAASALEAAPHCPVTSYCGLEASATELHGRTEYEWVRRGTCMDCWRELAKARFSRAF